MQISRSNAIRLTQLLQYLEDVAEYGLEDAHSSLDEHAGTARELREIINRRLDSDLYRVRWEIDVTASSHLDAAVEARAIMRDPNSTASVFQVSQGDETREIDLKP